MSNTTYTNSVDANSVEQEAPSGLFSTPARAFALGGSLVALLVVFSAIIFLAGARTPGTGPTGTEGKGIVASATRVPESVQANIPAISNIAQTGGLTRGSVPPNFEWNDPRTGQKTSLAAMRGKPVWLNFWATWCPPCRAEMPEIQKVYNRHPELTVLGISMGPRDGTDQVLQFIDQSKYNWTFIHDSDSSLGSKYQAFSIPMSYFIGSDGTIKAVSAGGIQADSMEGFLTETR